MHLRMCSTVLDIDASAGEAGWHVTPTRPPIRPSLSRRRCGHRYPCVPVGRRVFGLFTGPGAREVAYPRRVLLFVALWAVGIDRVRAQPAPRVRFSRPGDGGGALHNCVAALRARPRHERPLERAPTRKHAQRRALYVTREQRARTRAPAPRRIRFAVIRYKCASVGFRRFWLTTNPRRRRRRAGRCRRSARSLSARRRRR